MTHPSLLTTNRRRRHAVPVLLFSVAALAACGSEGGTATEGGSADAAAGGDECGQDAPVFEDGALLPLEDGFPSQPLTLLVVDEPGSPDAIYASQLEESLSDVSPVNINIATRGDFSDFGTWEALAYVEGESGGDEGYISTLITLPGSIVDLLVVDIEAATGQSLENFNPVVTTEEIPYAVWQNADAPWGDTLEDFIEYGQANPGEIRYISGGPGSSQDATFRWYMNELGVEFETIIGGGQGDRAIAVAAGEGDVTLSPQELVRTHFDAGRAEVLLVGGSEPAPEPWAEAPNAADLGFDEDPLGLQLRGFAVPPAVCDAHRAWLAALFTAATEDEAFIEARSTVPGLTINVRDHEESREFAESAYDAALPIMDDLGVLLSE